MNPAEATISAADAQARAAASGITLEALAVRLLPWAESYADVPVSRFMVGAVALGASGAVYAGANLELTGLPLSASVHAEQAAVANAWAHGETRIAALATSAAPCGHCRQFLNELADAAILRILVGGSDFAEPGASLAELLPQAFGPSDLGVSARLLEPADHGLSLDARSADPLAVEALAAANASYAPYTGGFAGLALRLHDGTTVTGRYAECAAYNPSLPALQAAFSTLALTRRARSEVVEAVLVEADAGTSQRTAAEAALRAIANLPLRYLRADTFPG
jgi:cytidine deaminase